MKRLDTTTEKEDLKALTEKANSIFQEVDKLDCTSENKSTDAVRRVNNAISSFDRENFAIDFDLGSQYVQSTENSANPSSKALACADLKNLNVAAQDNFRQYAERQQTTLTELDQKRRPLIDKAGTVLKSLQEYQTVIKQKIGALTTPQQTISDKLWLVTLIIA